MKRRDLIMLLGGLGAPLRCRGRPRARAGLPRRHHGYIRREEGTGRLFFDELARLGFVEGQNLRIEGRFSMPNEDAPEVATALAGMAVDAILTGGSWDTRAARRKLPETSRF